MGGPPLAWASMCGRVPRCEGGYQCASAGRYFGAEEGRNVRPNRSRLNRISFGLALRVLALGNAKISSLDMAIAAALSCWSKFLKPLQHMLSRFRYEIVCEFQLV
jgi:hypothetical protein